MDGLTLLNELDRHYLMLLSYIDCVVVVESMIPKYEGLIKHGMVVIEKETDTDGEVRHIIKLTAYGTQVGQELLAWEEL